MTTEERVKQKQSDRVFPIRETYELIGELIGKLGIGRFIPIEGDAEGDILPGGVYNESGILLASDGKLYRYWLGWDDEKISPDGEKGYYTLGEDFKDPDTKEPYPLFRELSADEYESYRLSEGYISARQELGLPITPEQQKVLDEK